MIFTKIMRIYVDTSVIGGCFDEEFSAPSNHLIDYEFSWLTPLHPEARSEVHLHHQPHAGNSAQALRRNLQ